MDDEARTIGRGSGDLEKEVEVSQNLISQSKDTSADWSVRLETTDGLSLVYTGSESVSAKLWAGDDQPGIELSANWNTQESDFAANPKVCVVDVTIAKASVEALDSGIYRIRVYVAGRQAADTWLKLDDAPGAGSAIKTYCSLRDLQTRFPAVEVLQSVTDQSGLAEVRGEARKWLDSYVLSSWAVVSGLSRWTTQMETFLGDNRLLVDHRVKDAVCYKSLAIFLGSKVEPEYQKLSAKCAEAAMGCLSLCRVSIDISVAGDGSKWQVLRLVEF